MSNLPDQRKLAMAERTLIDRLRTPFQVQRFLSGFPYNHEPEGGTLTSFRETVKRGEAHCLEAAIVAAAILEHHGYPPLLLSLASWDKLDHVVYVFERNGI